MDRPPKRVRHSEPGEDDDERAETPPNQSIEDEVQERINEHAERESSFEDMDHRTPEPGDEPLEAVEKGVPLKNAFSTLMAPKKPLPKTIIDKHNVRDGLGVYLLDPSSHDPKRVISYDDDFVFIYDMFPKSTIHTLLLPRDATYTLEQPLEVLSTNPEFLAKVIKKVDELKLLVASELKRRLSQYSEAEQAHGQAEEALEQRAISDASFDPDSASARASLPPGRDWLKSIRVGVHSRPSMNHLHIHIFSEDMYSPHLKKRQHYNSFNTRFMVDLSEFPLAKEDKRRVGVGSTNGLLEEDFVCWRCGKGFKNQFKRLKEHLEAEFDGWKRL